MSRRQRRELRSLAQTARVLAERRSRALHLIGRSTLVGTLSVADVARETGLSPRSIRRYRDLAAGTAAGTFSTAPDASRDISGRAGGASVGTRESTIRALRALSVGTRPPSVRMYRANRRLYGAPSVSAIAAEFGSWHAAVLAADLEPRRVGRPRNPTPRRRRR